MFFLAFHYGVRKALRAGLVFFPRICRFYTSNIYIYIIYIWYIYDIYIYITYYIYIYNIYKIHIDILYTYRYKIWYIYIICIHPQTYLQCICPCQATVMLTSCAIISVVEGVLGHWESRGMGHRVLEFSHIDLYFNLPLSCVTYGILDELANLRTLRFLICGMKLIIPALWICCEN